MNIIVFKIQDAGKFDYLIGIGLTNRSIIKKKDKKFYLKVWRIIQYKRLIFNLVAKIANNPQKED